MTSLSNILIDDMIFHILQFLDTETLVKICKKVSRQFYEQSLKIPLRLVFSSSTWGKLTHKKLQLYCENNKNNSSVSELLARKLTIDDIKLIVTSQNFDKLTKLDLISEEIGDEGVKLIASSKFFHCLKTLYLSHVSMSDEGVKYLVETNSTNITELDVSNVGITSQGTELLLKSKIVENLTYLNLGCVYVRSEALSDLSNCKQLKRLELCCYFEGNGAMKFLLKNENIITTLRSLSFTHNELSIEETKLLSETKFENLEELLLSGDHLTCSHVKLIASSPFMSKLMTLHLDYARVGNEGAIAIANSPHLKNLTELNLSAFEGVGGPITSEGATALANSENMQNLTNLQLAYNSLGDDGVKAIATSKFMSNLTNLNIRTEDREGGVTCDSLLVLATSEFMKNIRTLDVANNDIGSEGVKIILENMSLTSLCLQDANITDEGVKELTKCTNCSYLKTLSLANNEITNEALGYLAECEYLSNLTELLFLTEEISDEGLKHLTTSPHLQNLTNLKVFYNTVSLEGLTYFFENTKLLKLITLNLETQTEISDNENDQLFEMAFAILPNLANLTIKEYY